MLKFCLRERTVESLNDTEGILLIAGRYCIASEAMHIDFYTVSQKTGPLLNYNFGKKLFDFNNSFTVADRN